MKEEEKRDKIAKQIVILNPSVNTSWEIIQLLKKHIIVKDAITGASLDPTRN